MNRLLSTLPEREETTANQLVVLSRSSGVKEGVARGDGRFDKDPVSGLAKR